MPPQLPVGWAHEVNLSNQELYDTAELPEASMGEKSNEKSGVAIRERRRQGDTKNIPFIDSYARAVKHAGRVLVDLIPYVYDAERIIRICGEDETEHFVPINANADPLFDQASYKPNALMKAGFRLDPQSQEIKAPKGFYQENSLRNVGSDGDKKADEKAVAINRILNDLTVGKYDVVVEAGPSFATQRQEAAASMLEFLKAVPPETAAYVMDLVASNMDWPGADEFEKRLRKALPPGTVDPEPGEKETPAQQPEMDPKILAMADKQDLEERKQAHKEKIETVKTMADAILKIAQAEGVEAGTQLEMYKAIVGSLSPQQAPQGQGGQNVKHGSGQASPQGVV